MSLFILRDHKPLPLADDHPAEVPAGEGHDDLQAMILDAAEPTVRIAEAPYHPVSILERHAVQVDFWRDRRLGNVELRNVVALLAAHASSPSSIARLNHYRSSALDSDLCTQVGERPITNSHSISTGINWPLIAALLGCIAFWALVAWVAL